MYRTQYKIVKKEAVYIAGPECFYTGGFEQLEAMRRQAEAKGYQVTLPNDRLLDMGNPDKRKRADSIMANLADSMNETTVILSDLEAYRGAEADSGTVFEIGMAYAKGSRSYAYTRDKRSLASKNITSQLKNGIVYDGNGRKMPYPELPFSPNIIGSTKIVEGSFEDCLSLLTADLEEEQKAAVLNGAVNGIQSENTGRQKNTLNQRASCMEQADRSKADRPLLFYAGLERYEEKAEETLAEKKKLFQKYGFDVVTSLDPAEGEELCTAMAQDREENPYRWAARIFQRNCRHVQSCDLILADLNDYQGYEISNDIAFECGMGYQLGKPLYGYMDNTAPLIQKIPHFGEKADYRDQTGSKVEDFDYPANLMFACTMEIIEGNLEAAVARAAEQYDKGRMYNEYTT